MTVSGILVNKMNLAQLQHNYVVLMFEVHSMLKKKERVRVRGYVTLVL